MNPNSFSEILKYVRENNSRNLTTQLTVLISHEDHQPLDFNGKCCGFQETDEDSRRDLWSIKAYEDNEIDALEFLSNDVHMVLCEEEGVLRPYIYARGGYHNDLLYAEELELKYAQLGLSTLNEAFPMNGSPQKLGQ
ncbi:hypothetical protein F0231_20895 [Vibrio sp. RE86]|uniref:hypothetical protein n=1 Tax=Vibrio sp. RE86 TaxID=2607605 RepID=UPI0014936ACB|nr:hypothetical protein [Vibrio sp. RE86]NOH82166.1 hypothetical protein [Vibrio sp. RE86]